MAGTAVYLASPRAGAYLTGATVAGTARAAREANQSKIDAAATRELSPLRATPK